MAGAIIKRVLKSKIKPKPKPQYPKKVEGRVKRKAVRAPKELRGDTFLGRRRVLGGVKAVKKSGAIDFTAGTISGAGAGYLIGKGKTKKDAEAKKADKDLKKAIEKHKKLDRERKKKQADKKTNKKYYKGK